METVCFGEPDVYQLTTNNKQGTKTLLNRLGVCLPLPQFVLDIGLRSWTDNSLQNCQFLSRFFHRLLAESFSTLILVSGRPSSASCASESQMDELIV